MADTFFDQYRLEFCRDNEAAMLYRGQDALLCRTVGVLVFRPFCNETAERRKVVYEWMRIHTLLRHPNLLMVYKIEEVGGNICVVAEWPNGTTLKTFLGQGRVFRAEEAIRILVEALNALHAVHSGGGRHTRLTPESIVLRGDGTVKLTGFEAEVVQTLRETELYREKYMLAENLTYIAPEILRSSKHSWQSDIYSLAAVGYRLLARCDPYTGSNASLLMHKVMEGPPAELNERFPERLRAAIRKGMEPAPEQRFATAAEMASELMQCLAELD